MHSTLRLLVELGAKLHAPADRLLVEQVTARHALDLPEAVRALYEEANGSEGQFGEWLWMYWGIDSEAITLASGLGVTRAFVVGADNRRIDPAKYVRFFDCLIDAPLYAYCADSTSPHFGEVIGCLTDGGKFDAFVAAASVTRFLEMFVATRGDESVLVDDGTGPG